ncbi:hypothetical protein TELCIR_21056, partial [Teladorsagia circumcincta]
TGLLINVIRSLTTSVSEDQRELEKSRLQKGFQESEALIDRLVKGDLLNGRLARIEGLCQLRTMIRETSERLSDKIVDQIVEILVVDPFEHHAKLSRNQETVESRLRLAVAALSELGGGSVDMDRVMSLSRAQIDKQVAASVSLMRVRASIDENLAGDQTHLTQLVQMVEFISVALVSDHLDITPLAVKEPIDSKKPLFRFDATAFASGTSTTDPSLQKVLPSCERVLELCQEVHGLIVSMDLYADRFAALWLLVLTDYNKNVTDMYER